MRPIDNRSPVIDQKAGPIRHHDRGINLQGSLNLPENRFDWAIRFAAGIDRGSGEVKEVLRSI